jgi:Outer membrane protein beta-barrel domain
VARADRIDSEWRVSMITTVVMTLTLMTAMIAGPARADVSLYLAPQFGISGLYADTDGQAAGAAVNAYTGDDTDGSPLIGLSVGLEVPMNEVVPREWLEDMRLPSWPMRFELEAAGLRDYDFRTDGAGAGAEVYTSEIKSTTLVANTWTDVPLVTVWRPFQYVFGLGRQPRLRQWLEPGSLYFGGGIGFTALEIDGTDNVLSGEDDIIDFAWNVGAGINYALTDRVTLSTGYRYVGLSTDTGTQEVDLEGGVGADDHLEYDLQVHEFRVAIQVKLLSFRGVWR